MLGNAAEGSHALPGATAAGRSLAGNLRRILQSRARADHWDVVTDGFWCRAAPHGHQLRPQGWKLHISTTPPAAETALERSLPVLVDSGCAFKFAATLENLIRLNSAHAPRGNAGKFVTVYPDRDEDLPELARELHNATAGLDGPAILSDRPYAPGSVVHYRYGSFVDQRVLTNDGFYRDVVYDPAGAPVDDRREAGFVAPSWARSPFPPAEAREAPGGARKQSGGARKQSGAVLLGDRFAVREAIRHANKGGVYRALDTHSDTQVVIKEARPHAAVTATGSDARDALRAEARLLEVLAPAGVTPEPVTLFEHGGHLFLAEEAVPGTPLRRWILDRVRLHGPGRYLPEATDIAERLVSLLEATHRAGVIVRDFNPNNLMMLGDGHLRLLDLEIATMPGDPLDEGDEGSDEGVARGTPGYSAPEQMTGAAPALEGDYFSLGATICFVLTGADPWFPEDQPPGRPLRERLADWLSTGVQAAEFPEALRDLVVGLMDDQPGRRWTPVQARDALGQVRAALPTTTPAGEPDSLSGSEWDEAVGGMLDHLLATMDPADPEWLWPSPTSSTNDPGNLQHGAAGVVGVLARCYELTGDERIPPALVTGADWLERRLRAEARPPGLYFGKAGAGWALHEAGRVLDDGERRQRSIELVKSLPTAWSSPDLTHGTAGLGLTSLRLWKATGDREFAERARQAADALLRSTAECPGGVIWETPSSFDSVFAGQRFYGYAHGNAGIGYFLLATAAHTGRREFLETAGEAAETLLAAAADGGGGMRWSRSPGEEVTFPYWCSGASGIGTFLVRLAVTTGDDRLRKAAEMAGRTTMDHSWVGPLGQCHGVAGNAEFLLDLAQALDDPRYEAWAQDLARVIFARRVYRDGRLVFPGDEGDVCAEWAGGLSGILALFLRLRYGGSRMWTADPASWEVRP